MLWRGAHSHPSPSTSASSFTRKQAELLSMRVYISNFRKKQLTFREAPSLST